MSQHQNDTPDLSQRLLAEKLAAITEKWFSDPTVEAQYQAYRKRQQQKQQPASEKGHTKKKRNRSRSIPR